MLATIGAAASEGFGAIPLIGDAKDLVETGVAGVELGVAGVVAGYDYFFGPVVGPAPVGKSIGTGGPADPNAKKQVPLKCPPAGPTPTPTPKPKKMDWSSVPMFP